ncbi:MAG: ribosomal RNA small subunit methyltransferase A [Planctomycetes bacterium]|nr:ribosomal RNA small subunit methyltransferase A [Planctomycetota bacterium]
MSRVPDPFETSAGARRPPWAVFRAELEALGFRPTKTLGQNFLVDPNAARSIAVDAGLSPGTRVLEIGTGCGFLTLELADLGLEVLGVEIDERLLAVAQRLLAGRPNLRWLRTDALAGKHELAPALLAELSASEPWHLVANLPYSIAAPLLVLFSRLANPPRSMNVLVQEEVARRITAQPGESEWGVLTARLALLYRARAGREVKAQLFWPRPRVASRVAHLALDPVPGLTAADLKAFDRLAETLFQQRRKQIGTSLAGALGRGPAERLLARAGIDARARPEVLRARELLELSRSKEWIASLSPEAEGSGP